MSGAGKGQGDDAPSRTPVGLVSGRPSAAELLETRGALLTSSHLAELGLSRKAIDAVWRACPVVVLPGYKRPLVRVEDFLELVGRSFYDDDRVGPT